MQTVPLDLLSLLGNREQALELIRAATGLPMTAAHSLVLTLDAVSGSVLRAAGNPAAEARPVLAAMWQHPERITDTPGDRPVRPSAASLDAVSDYLIGLGERIHVIRRIRRLTTAGLARRAGIEEFKIRDLEAGRVWPTMQLLLVLAETFQVPVAMLADEHATPLRILRLLATCQLAA